MDEADQAEIPLAGDDVTVGAGRAGDTVRRPAGPHSPPVHALLTHLESVGFEGHHGSSASTGPDLRC